MKRAHQIRKQYEEILGPAVLAHIEAVVAAAPPPSPELVEILRRVFTRPGGEVPKAVPASTDIAA
ncbi:hypothetical protein [Streptomyces tanashiensis]|uniref:hypothetical protein n=1 Tax=Streptomyces tanashiensis TaxID=67367 RepID=UPI0033E040A7